MKIDENEWRNALKVGDKVAIPERYGAGFRIERVTHTTPTQVHVGTQKFRRQDGRSIGSSSWATTWIRPVTEEIEAAVAERRLRTRLRVVTEEQRTFSLSRVRAMLDAYDATEEG